METRWYQLESRPVRVLQCGAAHAARPELVIAPGLGALGYLVPTVRACSAWTRVHLLDVPGFGHRRTSRSPATLADVAGVLAEWLTTVGPRRVALLGHSTGAQAVLHAALAACEPEVVVLAGPTFPPAARRWWPLITRVARTVPHESFGEIPATVPEFLRGRRRVVTFLRTSMADTPERLVGHLSCPVIVVRGEHDAVADAHWAARLAVDAHGARVITVPGAHNFPYTHPRAAADVVREAACARDL